MKELEIRLPGEEDFFDAYNGTFEGDGTLTYGIRLGDGFIEAIKAPLPIKSPIECKSRLRHGKTVITGETLYDSREITLTFIILADSSYELEQKRKKFYDMLYGQWMDIRIAEEEEVYHLRYTGKSSTYGRNIAGTVCLITAKFEEPDPSNRE